MSQGTPSLPKKRKKKPRSSMRANSAPLCQDQHSSHQHPSHHKSISAVKLFAKMALLLLANQSALSDASIGSSSQTPFEHSSGHNRSAISKREGGLKSLTNTLNEMNIFEWPRISNKTHSKDGASRGSNSLVRAASGFSIEISRLPKSNVNDTSQRAHSIVGKGSSRVFQEADRMKEMALIRVMPEKDAHIERRPPTELESVHTNSSTGHFATSNKSARSISDLVVEPDRMQTRDDLSEQIIGPETSSMLNHPVDVAESKQVESNPDCALILKRTYILRNSANGNPDEWGDKFVFNDEDPDDQGERKQIRKMDLCIKHSDVDKALEEAKHRIKFDKPADLNRMEVDARSLASIGELNLATGLLLKKRFDLSSDEIMNALPMIDMSTSKAYWHDLCPKHVRPMVCMQSRYRTITAHCNNLKHPTWGASKTPYSRYLPPDYADGLSAPRAAHNGDLLPSARLITSEVHQDSDAPSHDYSKLFADWGQLLNHDVTRVAVGEAPDCCPQSLKGLCMPIPVPPNDPLYAKFNVKCLKFDRSLAAVRPKCLLGHRAQINLITSPVDASFVYGSTKQQAERLRAHSGGKMRALNHFDKHKLKPLLPAKTEEPDKDCPSRPRHLFCFEAGDVRVNEQTHLTVLHTIYLREHNRIAKQLGKLNMEWDDDKIYHETRHIVAACMQHVMVNEFLPLLLGAHHVREYQLLPSAEGFWNGYDPSVTISTGTAFASAAFRYGHSMVEGIIRRLDPRSGAPIKSENLRNLFKRPFWLYEPGAVDQLIAGMLLTPAEQTDPWISEELSGHLFQPPKAKFGHDLAAINIQRGRDQGVPGYNDWREWCGLKRARSFDELEPLLMHHTAMKYAQIYKHVDDIDLWSAGIAERKLPNSAVGPTMACIIARQFLNFKRGDRFWYENAGQPSSFTANQLREIKKMTLAKILCTNADDLPRIQPWAMRLPHPIHNAKVPCESLPTMNLKFWDSSLMDNLD